jgi:hypothetical protein
MKPFHTLTVCFFRVLLILSTSPKLSFGSVVTVNFVPISHVPKHPTHLFLRGLFAVIILVSEETKMLKLFNMQFCPSSVFGPNIPFECTDQHPQSIMATFFWDVKPYSLVARVRTSNITSNPYSRAFVTDRVFC